MQVLRKRLCLPLMLLALMFVLTSCIRINMDITIKKDGKADVSMLFAVQDSLGSMAGNEEGLGLSEEEANKYRADGWEVKDYAADGYTGYTLSKENVDLSQTDLMEGAEGSIRKEGSLYIVDIDLFSDSDQKEFTESAAMLKSMGGSFTLHLTLPEKPVKNLMRMPDSGRRNRNHDLLSASDRAVPADAGIFCGHGNWNGFPDETPGGTCGEDPEKPDQLHAAVL